MSITHSVKLIHNCGYSGIQDSIGKEFTAIRFAGLYHIASGDFNSSHIPPDTYLVFDIDCVEVIEISARK